MIWAVGESSDRERLRATFDEVPELYDRARPSYPPAVFHDLVALAELPAAARVLEIGVAPARRRFRSPGAATGSPASSSGNSWRRLPASGSRDSRPSR